MENLFGIIGLILGVIIVLFILFALFSVVMIFMGIMGIENANDKAEMERIRNGSSGGMNEGDFHSGTEGYSPNTAYPDTQYGGGHDEGDFNR